MEEDWWVLRSLLPSGWPSWGVPRGTAKSAFLGPGSSPGRQIGSGWLRGLCAALLREAGMTVGRVQQGRPLALTPPRVGNGERFTRFPVGAGDHILADRGAPYRHPGRHSPSCHPAPPLCHPGRSGASGDPGSRDSTPLPGRSNSSNRWPGSATGISGSRIEVRDDKLETHGYRDERRGGSRPSMDGAHPGRRSPSCHSRASPLSPRTKKEQSGDPGPRRTRYLPRGNGISGSRIKSGTTICPGRQVGGEGAALLLVTPDGALAPSRGPGRHLPQVLDSWKSVIG